MFSVHKTFSRTRSAVLALILAPSAGAMAGNDVGFISAVKGKPQVQIAAGRVEPAALMKPLAPGAKIILGQNESIKFCHESASKTFSVEGAGSVSIGDIGVNTEAGGPKVVAAGVCPSSSTPSETGGILSRGGLKPATSPK